jgi:hypothetical protein
MKSAHDPIRVGLQAPGVLDVNKLTREILGVAEVLFGYAAFPRSRSKVERQDKGGGA